MPGHPGQYLETRVPDSPSLSRAYSIGNAPHEDGSVGAAIREAAGGRFSAWAFEKTPGAR